MRKPILNVILIILFLLLTNKIQAIELANKWSERYNFTAITMEEGLPHNFIDDIIKDSQGFLWIATKGNGLARYDSYEFTSFNMETFHHKLRNNFIRKLCEDSFKRLWIASESGIDIIDLNTLQIIQFSNSNKQLEELCKLPVHYIYNSKAGNLWLASQNSLFKILFNKSGEIQKITEVCKFTQQEVINTICEIDGYLWINYKNGIYRIEEASDEKQEPAIISSTLELLSGGASIRVIQRKDNEIWIGTTRGLFRYNIDTKAIRGYFHNSSDENSLSQDFITDIVETSEHTMLIATLKGINLYDALTDKFERIDSGTDQDGNNIKGYGVLNCNFINCLLRDGDIVWIGTEAGGLNKMSRRKIFVKNYIHSDNIPKSISRNPINAIFEDETNTIWIGAVEGGINRLNSHTNTFEHYTMNGPTYLSHNSVSCFTSDNQGKLWVGTWGGGFGWIDKKNNNKKFHHINSFDNPDITWGFICAICYDSYNNVIWLTTNTNIYAYDLKDGTFIEPFKGLNLGGIEAGNAGYYIDKDNYLWLGLTMGLCRINLQTLRTSKIDYQLWDKKLDMPDSKLKEKVTFIYQSKDGTIWVGSNGYGFYKSSLDKNGKYTFQALTTKDGLINNSVRGILEDNKGNIWISTINGLSCYNPISNSFHNYTKKDGLLSNQFYWNAAFCASNGDLYLGSTLGLSVVKPYINYNNKKEVPIVPTHIRISEQEVYIKNEIQMHERNKSLQIEFAALDYDPSNSVVYSYRLKGFNDTWIKTNALQRTANYTNLHPGKYTFELRYSLDGKVWMENSLNLPITVKPYFYKTIWFTILTIIAILLFSYLLFSWRIRSLKKQRELLRTKVEERTYELEEQKKILSARTTELSQQNELLIQQYEEIAKQKTELIQMSEKIQELTIDKLAFFTNITHEFRTPLTLIIGPIQRALKLSCNPQVIEQLGFVERNSKYLLSLINQLMDFRKIESNKMKIVYNSGNIQCFFKELLFSFNAYAADKGIIINHFFHLPSYELLFDEDAMHKVIVNLISNALKFTPKGGQINIYASSIIQNGQQMLYFSVKDTGSGIAQKDIDKIFDQFYQSNNKLDTYITGQSGTGIGLYLCKHIVQLHGGKICVKNNKKEGCTFRILLPLQHAESSQNQKDFISQELTSIEIKQKVDNKLTILIVEDNKDMRDYIHSILTEYYNIVEASQGEEALEILQSKNIDFIISDLMMPIMDGMELSRRVKANFAISHIPFLMLTAKTSNETRIESFKIGVDEYILKPFDDNLLLARIANILETRKQIQKRFSYNMDIDILNIEEDSSDKKFLNKAMLIIKENYKNSDFEINDFVESMGVSRSLVYRKILSLTGQSAGHFIRNYRLNIARELILKNKKTRNMNISEIAYEVGFNDPKYFTRCFTKHFKVAPSNLMGKE